MRKFCVQLMNLGTMIIGQRFIIFLLCLICITNTDQSIDSLRLVQILFRHGDRSPVNLYPTDPNNVTVWPQGLGQLTKIGIEQEYQLGQYIRNQYPGFLSSTYLRKELYVRSTDRDRTLMSASSNLAGLYSQRKTGWQPIPVHTVAQSRDNLLNVDVRCLRYDVEMEKVPQSKEYKYLETKYKGLIELVRIKGGYNTSSIRNVFRIYDPLFCEHTHNLTIPPWVNDTVFQQILYLNDKAKGFLNFNDEMKYIRGGPLLAQISDNMKKKSQGHMPDRKMFYYSAHDTTVTAFLSALHAWDRRQPPYASAVLVELHEKAPGNFSVQVRYKNGTSEDANPLSIPGCGLECPLDVFLGVTAHMAFRGNWWDFCENVTTPMTQGLQVGIALVVTLAFLCVMASVVICYRSRLKNIPYQMANFNTTQEV